MAALDERIFAAIILIVFVIFVVPPLTVWAVGNYATYVTAGENTIETVAITAENICSKKQLIQEAEEKIKNIPYIVAESYPVNSERDAAVKDILEKYQQGLELTENEYITVASDLNKHSKLKFGFYQMEKICDIKNFLEK